VVACRIERKVATAVADADWVSADCGRRCRPCPHNRPACPAPHTAPPVCSRLPACLPCLPCCAAKEDIARAVKEELQKSMATFGFQASRAALPLQQLPCSTQCCPPAFSLPCSPALQLPWAAGCRPALPAWLPSSLFTVWLVAHAEQSALLLQQPCSTQCCLSRQIITVGGMPSSVPLWRLCFKHPPTHLSRPFPLPLSRSSTCW
jgi:hypothetical protein